MTIIHILKQSIDTNLNKYIDTEAEINDKDPEFKVGELVKFQNIRIFFEKFTPPIGQKKFQLSKKLKLLYHKYNI